jgi:hypothetical protein
MQFAAGIGRGLRSDRATAAKALVSPFQGLARHDYVFRSALLLTDALAGHTDDLVEQLTHSRHEWSDVARLQMGERLHLDRQPTDLVALARQVAAAQQQTTESHQIVVEAAGDELVGL